MRSDQFIKNWTVCLIRWFNRRFEQFMPIWPWNGSLRWTELESSPVDDSNGRTGWFGPIFKTMQIRDTIYNLFHKMSLNILKRPKIFSFLFFILYIYIYIYIYMSKQFHTNHAFKIFLLWLLDKKWCPVKWDYTNGWLTSNLFFLRWTKPNTTILVTSNQTLKGWDSKQLHSPPINIKVNYYISLIRTINVNYYISLIRAKNVNYYILLTRVKQIRIKHFVSFIQTYINIISLYFFVIIKRKIF